jgi:hypothetical protein
MNEPKIEPAKVTKPIQLLAAWLAGLILTNASFLGAAATVQQPSWASGVLVAAAVLNVPIFLFCLFLLQTKFRPEMQEDVFYARYLEKRYSAQTARTEFVEVAAPINIRASRPTSYRTKISINDLIPSYSNLRAELEKGGHYILETFGSTSGTPRKRLGPPKPFIVSIVDEDIERDIEEIKSIIRICRKYGLEGIEQSAREIGIDYSDIYIGSYSYKSSPYVLLSDALMKQIESSAFNWNQLQEILKKPNKMPEKTGATL